MNRQAAVDVDLLMLFEIRRISTEYGEWMNM